VWEPPNLYALLVMDPTLIDFPASFDTDRLTIRAPRFGDGAQIAQAARESLNDLRPWMAWARDEPNVEDSEARVRQRMADWIARKELLLLGFLRNTDTLVLSSGLHRIDWDARSFETGYWVRAKYAGQGFVTEAVNGITRFAFEHLEANRVQIRCDAENVRSIAVAKRCGFLLEGRLRHDDLGVGGDLRDTLVFSKISPDEFHRYDQ